MLKAKKFDTVDHIKTGRDIKKRINAAPVEKGRKSSPAAIVDTRETTTVTVKTGNTAETVTGKRPFRVRIKRRDVKVFFIYLFRWQLSSIILYPCVLLITFNKLLSVVISNIIGGCIFFFVDKYIFVKLNEKPDPDRRPAPPLQ